MAIRFLPTAEHESDMFENEGYEFMGAAFEVYNYLGYGMAEEVYQESLEIELGLRGIPFASKREISLAYKDKKLNKKYVPDLFVYEGIVAELKAAKDLTTEYEAQLFNYLRISRQTVGYLLNYGVKGGLQWKRFIVTDLHTPH